MSHNNFYRFSDPYNEDLPVYLSKNMEIVSIKKDSNKGTFIMYIKDSVCSFIIVSESPQKVMLIIENSHTNNNKPNTCSCNNPTPT